MARPAPASGDAPARGRSPTTALPAPAPLGGALTVERMLDAGTLTGAQVLAGGEGLERRVERLNVMEVPDILPWVKPREFLLTTAYPLRETPQRLTALVEGLDERGLAGMGIKLGRYLDTIPDDLLRAADRRGFPVVQLPEEVGFDDILNEVLSDILNRQAALLSRSEESHRALLQIILSGGGWPEIARDLASLLDAAIIITDQEGSVRAAARYDEASERLEQLGLLANDQQLLVDDPRLTDPRIRQATAGSGAVDGLLAVSISGTDRVHGRIVALPRDRRLDAGDVLALENASTVAALVVTKEEAVAAVESKYASDFLHDLLADRVADPGDAVARSAALGWDVDRPLVALVATPRDHVEPGERQLLERVTRGIRTALASPDPRAAVVRLSGEVVVLAGSPGEREATRRLASVTAAEGAAYAGQPVTVGVSRTVEGPTGIATAYEQADRAVQVGRQIAGEGAVAHFDDLGLFRLLSLVPDPAELTAFSRETLGAIATDGAEARELRRTLGVLLEDNGNVAAAARRLHVHYNTLRYRIGKLERELGPFTRDARLRLDLEVALRITGMRGLPT